MKKTHKLLAATLALLMLLVSLSSCSAPMKDSAPDADKMFAGGDANAEKDHSAMTPEDSGEDDAVDVAVKENPFIQTATQNISTFSADVDTASYSYFRKLVNSGASLQTLKNSASAFRTEEFINYFCYNVEQPAEGELFGTDFEITACPWNSQNLLLRMTFQAEASVETAGNNLVFLIDVSGSMNSADKLELLKRTFSYLVGNLTANDVVSIVTYSGKEEVVLDGCSGLESERIMNAINSLRASGSTNGEAGLSEAYRIAEKNMIADGNNRIIMASDGDLNVGISSESELKAFIEGKRDQGIYLSVMGFGSGNYRDSKMETLADNGNGVYYYIDGESEAEKVLGTDLLGTLYTVAEDVKLQLTFDPQYITAYRLIGYENRILNEEDFEDDTKDAGDVGAGHQVTVCYELVPTTKIITEAATPAAWMELEVRYKNRGEPNSQLNEYEIGNAQILSAADEDMKFISCVIRTVMVLHNSQYLGDTTLEAVLEELNSLDLSAYPEREEFRDLIDQLV